MKIGTPVRVDGFGLSGAALLIAGSLVGPERRTFYTLRFAATGNVVPGYYDARMVAL